MVVGVDSFQALLEQLSAGAGNDVGEGVDPRLAAIELTAIVWLYLEEGRYVSAEELFQRTQNTYVRDLTKGTSCRYVDTLYPNCTTSRHLERDTLRHFAGRANRSLKCRS